MAGRETARDSVGGTATSIDAGVVIRPYRPGDEAEITAAFNRVFPWASRAVEEWRSRFGANPEGVRCELAVLPDGRVAAQFTGWTRRARVDGVARSFSEIVDSLSDPSFRQGLKKPGLFARTALSYIERNCRPEGEAFAYGLPNPDALRLGQRLLGYTPLRRLELRMKDVGDAEARTTGDGRAALTLEDAAGLPSDVDDLLTRAASSVAVGVVRDRRYLEFRYRLHGIDYRTAVVRDVYDDPVALFILRDRWLEGDCGPDVTGVAEWITDPLHPAAPNAAELLPAAAASGGGRRVAVVVPPWSREDRVLSAAGFRRFPTKFTLVGRTYDAAVLPLERAAAAWRYSLGDFDVI